MCKIKLTMLRSILNKVLRTDAILSKWSVYLLALRVTPCPSTLFCFAGSCIYKGSLSKGGTVGNGKGRKRGESVCSHFLSMVSPPGAMSPVIPELYGLGPQRQPPNGSGSTKWTQLWKCHLAGVALSTVANSGDAPLSLCVCRLFYNLCQQISILKFLYIFYFPIKTLIMPYFPMCITTNNFAS